MEQGVKIGCVAAMMWLTGCSTHLVIASRQVACRVNTRISDEESCFGERDNEKGDHYCYMALVTCVF